MGVAFFEFGSSSDHLNIKDSSVSASDIALFHDLGKENLQLFNFPLFGIRHLAYQKASKLLKELSYPTMLISLEVNRYGKNLQVGDFFKFSYTQYNITEKVFRIVSLEEQSPGTDIISIKAIESVDYIAASIDVDEESQGNEAEYIIKTLDPLVGIVLIEPTWPIVGDNITLMPVVRRVSTFSTSYSIYYSLNNGETYNFLETFTHFGDMGMIQEKIYKDNPFDPEFEISIMCIGENAGEYINTIDESTTDEMFLDNNLAIIGEELISFKKILIDEVEENLFTLTGINRGLYGTIISEHDSYSEVIFPNKQIDFLKNINFTKNSQIRFKIIPLRAGAAGDLSEALEIPHTFAGKARTPLTVCNININSNYGTTEWDINNDMVVTWECAVRGGGCGTKRMDSELKELSFEGWFAVDAFTDSSTFFPVGGAITGNTVTITQADFLEFLGAVPETFKIRVTPYIIAVDGETYSGEYKEIQVTRAF